MSSSTHLFVWRDQWWRFDEGERPADLSRRLKARVVCLDLQTSSDLIWLKAWDKGKETRSLLYTPEFGWTVAGRPLGTERKPAVKRLTSTRALAVPDGYALLEAVLGVPFDDLEWLHEARNEEVDALGDTLERARKKFGRERITAFALIEGPAGKWSLACETDAALAAATRRLSTREALFKRSPAARELLRHHKKLWPKVPVRTKDVDGGDLAANLDEQLGAEWWSDRLVWRKVGQDVPSLRDVARAVVKKLPLVEKYKLLARLTELEASWSAPAWLPVFELIEALSPVLDEPDALLRWVSVHPKAARVFVGDLARFQRTFMGFAARLDRLCAAMMRAPDEEVIEALETVHRRAVWKGTRLISFASTR